MGRGFTPFRTAAGYRPLIGEEDLIGFGVGWGFGVPDVAFDAGFGSSLVLFVVGLVLKHEKLVCFVIGAVVGQV